MTHLKPNWKRG